MLGLKGIPDNSIDCIITSPPYWGLRDYKVEGQIGLEKTPEEYVAKLVEVFREVRRVLRPTGTLWLNLGDCYFGGQGRWCDSEQVGTKQATNVGSWGQLGKRPLLEHPILKPKDLCGIPWRIAFALQADGWWLRQDIIWSKPNPMPESVTDRCTKSHEYIFLMTKSSKYYFDNEAIKEDATSNDNIRPFGAIAPEGTLRGDTGNQYTANGKRNKRDVWMVNVQSNGGGVHFATFSEELITPCVLAGCPIGGVVMDCFMGTGVVGVVAKKNNCGFTGIELSEVFYNIAKRRIDATEWGLPYA